MRTILTWYESAGPFTVPIALVGIAGLLLLTERVVSVVKQSRVRSRPFMERVISLARSDKIDEALRLCSEHQSALPDLGRRDTDALVEAKRFCPKYEHEATKPV